MKFRLLFAFIIFFLTANFVHAHHGQNFLWLEDASLPHHADGHVMIDYEWASRAGESNQTYTLGSMLGIVHGVAASFSASAGDEMGSTEWQSMQPTLHVASDLSSAVTMGFSIGYQIALSESAHAHIHDEPGCDPDVDLGPDAPPCVPGGTTHIHNGGHAHSAIHNHEVNAAISRFIVAAELSPETLLVGNLFVVLPEGDDVAFGYALGLRQKFSSSLSMGLEAIGDLQGGGEHTAMVAAYWEPVDSLVMKVGVGAGLNDESADLLLRTSIVWNF
jgi:hypothetical protein